MLNLSCSIHLFFQLWMSTQREVLKYLYLHFMYLNPSAIHIKCSNPPSQAATLASLHSNVAAVKIQFIYI